MDDDHCREVLLAAQVARDLQHLILIADVEIAGRFVQQQERRLLRQRTGEHDLLPLAAGEPVEEPAAHILQIQIAHGLVYDVVVVLRHAPGHVGTPPEHDHVVHGHLRVGHVLCHEGHALCDLPVGECEQILAVDAAVPAVSREDAVHTLKQCALTDAVVAEHGQKAPVLQFEAHVAEDWPPAFVVIAEMVHTNHVRPLPLNSRYKNSGPPRNAVSAPIGRMTGMMTTRAARSLSSSSAAPASTEPGMR